jgi:anti-sigma B factor antagonist
LAETDLEVLVRVLNDDAVLALRGEVDAYTGPSLSEYLDAAVAETAGNVTLNLSQVSFVDSSGIAVLVAAAKKLRDRGKELVVEAPPAMVAKVLEITGVTKLVRIERSAQ